MKLGLETESFHLFFQCGQMNIFQFIERTVSLGLDGVQINIIPDLGLHPEFGTLNSDNPSYLKDVRNYLDDRGLYCEIDTCLTTQSSLEKAIYFAVHLGADIIRTYLFRKDDYTPSRIPQIMEDIKFIIPLLQKHGIRLALENHELETASEIVSIIQSLNSEWVGALCDVGNGMMVGEEPFTTIETLAPYIFSTHFKDHIVIEADGIPMVTGVPVGYGSIDVDMCFRMLAENINLRRINIETCYPYSAPFSKSIPCKMQGTFSIKEPPFPLSLIHPRNYYYPGDYTSQIFKMLLNAQDECVIRSVETMKKLQKKYSCY